MDRIYYNGKIITMADRREKDALANVPEAVLVQGSEITAVGSLKEIKNKAATKVELYDLKGACMMPAFIDTHSHFVMNGQMSSCVDLSDCVSFDDIISALREYKEKDGAASKDVIVGYGYDHNFLREGRQPDKRILDKVSTEIPILIMHISFHLACANSAALKLAGIDAYMQNPEGGVIGRLQGSSEPSGYLEESAMTIVQQVLAPKIKINFESMIKKMQESYFQYGITTVQDGASTKQDILILENMSSAGLLQLDVVAYPLITSGCKGIMEKYRKAGKGYKNHLKVGGYKLILDGSPQGRTAWMSKPYLGGEDNYCGFPWMSDEDVYKYIKQAVSEHRQILVHCNGDAASEQFLDAYEKVVKDIGITDNLRPVMIHCQTVRKDQLDRMAKLNIIASIFVGHVWYWGDVHMKNFGIGRGENISPVKDALDRGLHINFHQDTPVTKPDMLHSVWCAVNRISRGGKVIGKAQRVSVFDALRAVTIEAAYEYFEEDLKGSISVGKKADLVILDRSPLEVDPIEIRNISVLETIKGGEVVYRKKAESHGSTR